MLPCLQPFKDEVLASPVLSNLWIAFAATVPFLSWQSVSATHALDFVQHVRHLTDRMHTLLSHDLTYWSLPEAWVHTWQACVGVQHFMGMSPCMNSHGLSKGGLGLSEERPFGCKSLDHITSGPILWAVQPHHRWQELVAQFTGSGTSWVLGPR